MFFWRVSLEKARLENTFLQNTGNDLQKEAQQQQQEAADKKAAHPRSGFTFFSGKREKQRDKPQ
jgi:hypothetical protein